MLLERGEKKISWTAHHGVWVRKPEQRPCRFQSLLRPPWTVHQEQAVSGWVFPPNWSINGRLQALPQPGTSLPPGYH